MKNIFSFLIIIVSGIFLEFWLYTFSRLLSIKNFYSDQLDWLRFVLLMAFGNLFMAAYVYVVSKRTAKILKIKNNFILNLVLVWVVSALAIICLYEWLIDAQYRLIGLRPY